MKKQVEPKATQPPPSSESIYAQRLSLHAQILQTKISDPLNYKLIRKLQNLLDSQ